MTEVQIIDLLLLLLVAATAVAVVQVRSLFSATMLGGVYSLLMALVWSNMHALDVAFTEASVGAGISTILLLGALVKTNSRISKDTPKPKWGPLAICALTGAMLIYGTLDMPKFGDPSAPIHTHRVPKLLSQTVDKVPSAPERTYAAPDPHHPHPSDDFSGHVPNTVTSLLAAYRGFDTMFETTVIFVAGASMILLLRRRKDDPVESEPELPPEKENA